MCQQQQKKKGNILGHHGLTGKVSIDVAKFVTLALHSKYNT